MAKEGQQKVIFESNIVYEKIKAKLYYFLQLKLFQHCTFFKIFLNSNVHKTSLTPPFVIDVPVSSQDSELSSICILGVAIFPSLRFFYSIWVWVRVLVFNVTFSNTVVLHFLTIQDKHKRAYMYIVHCRCKTDQKSQPKSHFSSSF